MKNLLLFATLTFAATINAQPAAPVAKVNINSATVAQLEYLPGVSSKIATAIVAGRPYRVTAELTRVKGIKAARFARIAKFVTVKGPTTAAGKVSGGVSKSAYVWRCTTDTECENEAAKVVAAAKK